ncbi:HNH endonuclease signature motif containing protein [Pseudoclavibacter endophyticus]|uniref:HNH endonuclease signature motif containing protein n=1 Tax=Pseudoclavibacter endophyticus TaxID=1778590 RepID=UPI00166D1459|nr:HNH endonuclease signature motif containing protein [Pseudoclavibacter endophyticus]
MTVGDELRIICGASLARVAVALADDELREATNHELFETLAIAGEVIRRAGAVVVEAVAQVEQRSSSPVRAERASTQAGCASVTELVQRCTRVSRQTAKGYQAAASAITRDVSITTGEVLPARFPALREAMIAGEVGVDGMDAAVRPIREAEPRLSAEERLQADALLAAHVRGIFGAGERGDDGGDDSGDGGRLGAFAIGPLATSADGVRRHAKLIAMYLDEDGAEPREARAMRKRGLTIGRERDGLVHVRGNLLPETAAQLQLLLDAHLNPKRKGPRFVPTPSAPAHPEAAERAERDRGAGRDGANSDGTRRRGVVRDDANADDTNGDVEDTSGDGTSEVAGVGEDGGEYRLVGPDPDHPELFRVDDRTRPQEQHDALAGILATAARHHETPAIGGSAPTLLVTVDANDLAANRGWATIDRTKEPVSISVARHIACTGVTQRLLQDRNGRILALGTSDRVFNAHQRRAILHRDGGCIIPGCTVPSTWCEIHHVHEHAAGGATHTDNGVALCWHHHRTLDTSGWRVRIRGGTPEVHAPAHWDPFGTWRPARSRDRPPRHSHRRHAG